MQRLTARQQGSADVTSIQGILEYGLEKFLRLNEPAIVGISSRTDNGVHAIESTATFEYKENEPLSPEKLCQGLNFFLKRNLTDIRIRRVVEVPTDFYIRKNIRSRTYCYKIAVPQHDYNLTCLNLLNIDSALPIASLNRVQIVPPPFDPDIVQEASKVFLGTWNFKTFSLKGDERIRTITEEGYMKTVYRISLTKINPFFQLNYGLDPLEHKIDFYDFHVEGSGFLRRQVRRMVGALLGVGTQQITQKDILFMLENPSSTGWNTKCQTAHADGLYLKSVNFKSVPVLRGPLC